MLPEAVDDDDGDDREPEKGREDAFCAWFHDLKGTDVWFTGERIAKKAALVNAHAQIF